VPRPEILENTGKRYVIDRQWPTPNNFPRKARRRKSNCAEMLPLRIGENNLALPRQEHGRLVEVMSALKDEPRQPKAN
jgi:hypothetical protein